jgi:predicted alpha/beta superfamily hydrolase
VDNDQLPLADTEVHYLESSRVGEEFKIFVGHCPGGGVEPPGVLYLTDANGMFGMAVDVIRGMQLYAHLPPLLVVGIGYRAGGLAGTLAARTRDLTPSEYHDFAALVPDQSVMGGADHLLAFIRTELMSWVGSHYPIDPDHATYFGHSFGGLFGTWVLLNEPETFQRYAIGSPSLWWDEGVVFRRGEEYARVHDDLPAKVFFGIGANETHEGRIREAANLPADQREVAAMVPFDMVADLQRLVALLGAPGYPGLAMRHAVLPEEFHVTVAPLVLSRGLRYLYDAPT